MHLGIDRMVGYPSSPDIRPGNLPPLNLLSSPHYWHLMIITGHLFKLVHLRTLTPPPHTHTLVLTSSGGYQNMCSWVANGMHPTGMLSCLIQSHSDTIVSHHSSSIFFIISKVWIYSSLDTSYLGVQIIYFWVPKKHLLLKPLFCFCCQTSQFN